MDTTDGFSCQEILAKIVRRFPKNHDEVCKVFLKNPITRIYYSENGFHTKAKNGQRSTLDVFVYGAKTREHIQLNYTDMGDAIELAKEYVKREYKDMIASTPALMSKRQFIEEFVKQHGGYVDHQENFKNFPFKNVEVKLKLAMQEYCRTLPKDSRFDWKDDLAVIDYKSDVSDQAYELLKEHLKYDGSTEEESLALAKQLVEVWRDPKEIPFARGSVELDARIILHFIWNCKRKLHRKEAELPIFLIALGAQGCGKSIAILRFLSPLNHMDCSFSSSSTLSKVADTREDRTHSRQLVLIIDELVGLSKSDINKLKSFITAQGSTYDRNFHSQSSTELYKYTSYIGSTNDHLSSVIRDPTGMRRFWQIYFPQRDREKLNFDAVNSFPYEKLWRSVNQEDDRCWITQEPYATELFDIQKTLSLLSPTQEYIKKTNLLPQGEKDIKLVLISTMYSDYKKFCKASNVYPVTLPLFRVELKNFGVFITNNGNSESIMYVNTSNSYREYSDGDDTPVESGELEG